MEKSLSDILQDIDLNKFKLFIKNKEYITSNPNHILSAIILWGNENNKDFNKYNTKDLKKIAEYLQDLILG